MLNHRFFLSCEIKKLWEKRRKTMNENVIEGFNVEHKGHSKFLGVGLLTNICSAL
jgi:hypothetical protein